MVFNLTCAQASRNKRTWRHRQGQRLLLRVKIPSRPPVVPRHSSHRRRCLNLRTEANGLLLFCRYRKKSIPFFLLLFCTQLVETQELTEAEQMDVRSPLTRPPPPHVSATAQTCCLGRVTHYLRRHFPPPFPEKQGGGAAINNSHAR